MLWIRAKYGRGTGVIRGRYGVDTELLWVNYGAGLGQGRGSIGVEAGKGNWQLVVDK